MKSFEGMYAKDFLHPNIESMRGSMILKIVKQVHKLRSQGKEIINLTIGDFDTTLFPVHSGFSEQVQKAYLNGKTNYPPSAGVLELRKAVASLYRNKLNLDIDESCVCITSGARPPLYASWRMFTSVGDKSVSFLPAWNIGYYAHLNQTNHHFIKTQASTNFHNKTIRLR